MARRTSVLHPFRLSVIALLIAAFVISACGGGAPAAPAQEAAPAAAEPAAAAPAAPAAAAPASANVAVSADEYQAQRENCTWATPCWPEVSSEMPTSFQEAPMLAAMVAAGTLPPVEERLPLEPLVIAPAEMIGQYSGTLRRAFTGPGDRQNVERWVNDYGIFWNTGASELRPRILKAWEANADATVWTFHLRRGMKWSDGEPYTAKDYQFWYDHMLTNELIRPTIPWWMNWGGSLAVMATVDDFTFTITFAQSFPAWADNMSTATVAGQFHQGRSGLGLVAPAHYLEQFHPDFVGEEKATELAKAAGFESWHLHFLAKNDSAMNPELPVTTPWKPITTIATQEYVLERNPYFVGVDTAGNQLPYFDRISLELVEELEVLNLRAIAGNYTIQGRHIDFSKLPVIRENEAQGEYFVNFWTSSTRHPVKVAFNQDWKEDPEITAYTVDSLDFRKALSLAIERSEINETFFLGVGKEASFCPQNTPPYFNSSRWDDEFGGFDPAQANEILDSIGLDKKDSEGFRLLPSGKRLTLRMDAVSGAFLDYPSIGERVAQMWQEEIGIHLQVNPVERSLWQERMTANQPMMNMFETGEWNPAVTARLLPSERWAPIAAVWAANANPDPAEYDGPQWIKDMVAKHWAALQEPDPAKRQQLFIEGTEIMCDNQARLGIVVDVPVYTTIIKNNVRNVPKPMEWVVYAQTPGNGLPEQFFQIQD